MTASFPWFAAWFPHVAGSKTKQIIFYRTNPSHKLKRLVIYEARREFGREREKKKISVVYGIREVWEVQIVREMRHKSAVYITSKFQVMQLLRNKIWKSIEKLVLVGNA